MATSEQDWAPDVGPYVAAAFQYCQDVVDGLVVAGQLTRLACERQLTDLERDDGEFPYYFDPDAASSPCALIESLPHIEGEWAARGELIRLEPWQVFLITTAYGWRHKETGDRRFRTCYWEVARKNAKALALDTEVATPTGFVRMGAIRPGDLVLAMDGTPTPVLGVSPVMIGNKCYRVELSTGEQFTADAGHQWIVRSLNAGRGLKGRPKSSWKRPPLDVRTTKELAETLTVGGRGARNHAIPVSPGPDGSDVELPIAPYVLGAWLGDGHSAGGRLTSADLDVISAIELTEGAATSVATGGRARLYRIGPNYRTAGVTAAQTLAGRLRALGVLNDKHVPDCYLYASRAQRLELLRGLLDTDGTISKAGQITYVGKNERLVRGVAQVAASLGLKPSVRCQMARLYGRDICPVWAAQMWSITETPLFLVARKAARQRPINASRRTKYRAVKAVTAVPSVPVKCLTTAAGNYLIGRTYVPTHNSTIAAGLAINGLVNDGEAGAQVYSAATKKDQAKIVFDHAREMIRRASILPASKHWAREIVSTNKNVLVVPSTASKFAPLDREASNQDGLNIHAAINDELHAWKRRDLYAVIESATGARRQPLVINITTAGYNLGGICYELRGYGLKILQRVLIDETFFPAIWTLDADDDPWNPANWPKANPNYGISVYPLDMQAQARKAKAIPSAQTDFLTKRLNVWCSAESSWMDMRAWDKCARPAVTLEQFAGLPCVGAFDVAEKLDVTARCLLFERVEGGKRHIYSFMRYYLPEAAPARTRNNNYDGWVRRGLIELTDGNVIDIDRVSADLVVDSREFEIGEVAFDPHNATSLAQALAKAGVRTVEFRQTPMNFDEPMRWLEAMVQDGTFHHTGDPVLTWMVSNVVIRKTGRMHEFLHPRKERDENKIDGLVTVCMALKRLMAEKAGFTIYEERGVVTV